MLVLLFCTCNRASGDNDPKYYEYDFTNIEKTKKVTLRFAAEHIGEYQERLYHRNAGTSVSMWYPSLLDRVWVNVWVSTARELKNAKIKPTANDRKISVRVRGNAMVDPNVTLQGDMISLCHVNSFSNKFVEDGQIGNFDRYKHIRKRNHYLYHPIEKIKGVYCIKCNGSTCSLIGVTDFGVHYTAIEKYVDGRMNSEVLEIHKGVNEFLARKIVKTVESD